MANELSALIEVGGEALDRLVVTPAESLHMAVSDRVYGSIGPISAPSRFVHDRIARAAYGAVRLSTRAATSAAAFSIKVGTGNERRPLSGSRRGRAAISALNALIGDQLEEKGSPLAIPMAVRHGGADLRCDPVEVRRAYRRPTARLAVFLHGLGETEERWRRGGPRHGGRGRLPFSAQLRRDFGFTPIDIRYNSGLHISRNGRHLSDLLEELSDVWPMVIDELVLIGHSMGGLVARSALEGGDAGGRRWQSRARHLITLGSPHTGVPLEKTVHVASRVLRALPETRPLATILDLRSAGIRDLRSGHFDDDGSLPRRRSHVPSLPGCTYTFIAATLTRDPAHPLGRLGGDLLVRAESAAGRRRDGSVVVPSDEVIQVGPLSHFDLLDHPLVYAQIREVLSRRHQKR
jgi:pimeloyl-ACP methyl ester carboxylesterase